MILELKKLDAIFWTKVKNAIKTKFSLAFFNLFLRNVRRSTSFFLILDLSISLTVGLFIRRAVLIASKVAIAILK